MGWDKKIDGTLDKVKYRKDNPPELPIYCLPTLNKRLWGIPQGQLTIIGGRPSMGKTTLILNFIHDWLVDRKNIVFFSWDDSEDRLVKRMLSIHAGVDAEAIKDGKFGHLPEDANAVNGLKNILIPEHFSCKMKRGRTVADFDRLVNMHNDIDCVVVDYLQLVSTEGFSSERHAFNAFLAKAKEIAQNRNCGMIVLSQMGRDSVMPDRRGRVRPPLMSEIKGTGRAEQEADVVLLLHWDWFYHRDHDISPKWSYKIKVEKNKDGDLGDTLVCYYYGKYLKFSESPLDDEHIFYTKSKDAGNPFL